MENSKYVSKNKLELGSTGLALNPDGSPREGLVARVRRAAEAARANPDAGVILTGGDPARTGITEAAAIARLIQEFGIAEDRLLLEGRRLFCVQWQAHF